MRVDILDHWHELIEAAEALGIGDRPLYVDFDDLEVLEAGVMAMVIYKSRLSANGKSYTFTLNTDHLALEIRKIYVQTAMGHE